MGIFKLFFALVFQVISCSFCFCQIRLNSTYVDTTTIISGLDIPWEIIWGPDDHIWLTERFGRISRINPFSGKQYVLKLIEDVHQISETGLLGMVLHPDFENQPKIFVVYTYLENSVIKEKVVRFDYKMGELINPLTLLENIPGAVNHTGSRLLFLADTTLLITTGDALNATGAQDLSFLGGKTLRINPDGSIPHDNPFPGSPVWTLGHRNSQGLILTAEGKIYTSEHGPQNDDEINILLRGRNYGWPEVNGYCDLQEEISFCEQNDVAEPIYNWIPTIAPSGICYYSHPAIPEFNNSILVATLRSQRLVSLKISADGETVENEDQYFVNTFGRIRDVIQGPSGEIYIATNGFNHDLQSFSHSIIRIENKNYQLQSFKKFIVFPNPAERKINLMFFNPVENQNINLFDATGKLILSQTINSDKMIIKNNFSAGLYLIRLQSSEKIIETQKIVIK